jgi:hypothetical protein
MTPSSLEAPEVQPAVAPRAAERDALALTRVCWLLVLALVVECVVAQLYLEASRPPRAARALCDVEHAQSQVPGRSSADPSLAARYVFAETRTAPRAPVCCTDRRKCRAALRWRRGYHGFSMTHGPPWGPQHSARAATTKQRQHGQASCDKKARRVSVCAERGAPAPHETMTACPTPCAALRTCVVPLGTTLVALLARGTPHGAFRPLPGMSSTIVLDTPSLVAVAGSVGMQSRRQLGHQRCRTRFSVVLGPHRAAARARHHGSRTLDFLHLYHVERLDAGRHAVSIDVGSTDAACLPCVYPEAPCLAIIAVLPV